MVKHLLPLFPEHTCYVEPFCGAGALYFLKQPSHSEVINDINGELVNLYKVIRHHPDEFIKEFRWTLNSRQQFKWHQITPTEPLTDIQRAARFYYLQKSAFGGKVVGQNFGTSTTAKPNINLFRIEEDMSQAHMRLHSTTIENLPWQTCISKYDRPHTLFYCDPPYYGTEGYGVDFGLEQYDTMAGMARSMQGKMIISVNDIPEMRKAFDGLYIKSVPIKYTLAGGGKEAARRELIITNWNNEVAAEPQR